MEVIVGVLNEDLVNLATGTGPLWEWVDANLKPYYPEVNMTYVVAGNEVVPGDLSSLVGSAIRNLQGVLLSYKTSVLVTTAVALKVLGSSYPPSARVFSDSMKADVVSSSES
ncbi:hypothetical protein MLD38_005849 [Melastoma candidum]|uniref:Uncharacterized protein n=1 Tax=Melastoma candidum TaxID=119954 RepID=A0ACB9RL25_9MYRT|nr:hypothetical protein MLD38_005849 [Melastoma candidum]